MTDPEVRALRQIWNQVVLFDNDTRLRMVTWLHRRVEQERLDAVVAELEAAQKEVTHRCPPEGSSVTPCCGLTPFELPSTDRMTLDNSLATCRGRTEASEKEDK